MAAKFAAIFFTMILVDNYVLVKFLGICPFLGVSKKLNSAFGMSCAVIFVMTLATAVTWPIQNFLLTPEAPYEERGFVPNVCFPCATLQDPDTGRIAIYYGAADTVIAVAEAREEDLIQLCLRGE